MPLRSETVIAAYRPKPGQAQALRKLVREHRAMLDAAQLVTHKPTILLRARSDGTLLEIFEWVSARAADKAHQHAGLRTMWNRLAAVADFVPLSAVAEAGKAFSHFEAVNSGPGRPSRGRVPRLQNGRSKR
jgi:hypothetical protein